MRTFGPRQTRLLVLACTITVAMLYISAPRLAADFRGAADGWRRPYSPHHYDAAGNLIVEDGEQSIPTRIPGGPHDGPARQIKPGCEDYAFYEHYMYSMPEPHSTGRRKFPYVRPPPNCRTFNLTAMETLIEELRSVIVDPDLFRLFENSFPNTLDTMVKWRGFAVDLASNTTTDQELTYVITGDIDAMWLRDSGSQIMSYASLLEASDDTESLAGLWRGLVNAHARYVLEAPYCHSFQPPIESGIPPTANGANNRNYPFPAFDPEKTFDCKWELDSLASFLQISATYFERTGDVAFFAKYDWVKAVEAAVDAAGAMRLGTYAANGKVQASAYTFTGWTSRGSETLTNDGLGNPVKENGMVRTAFRPSDDAAIFQLLVPANMMFAKYLESASAIMAQLEDQDAKAANLTSAMREFAHGIRQGIDKDAIVSHRDFGDIFAYEVDGFGGANLMDDANVPSLLAMPMWNYSISAYPGAEPKKSTKNYSKVYQNTRQFVLSDANPYFSHGPVLSAVGSPHVGPGKGWPMAAIIAALTAYEPDAGLLEDPLAAEKVVAEQLQMVLDSTGGSGVVHESVGAWDERDWTRAWFGWANGLFGELILRIYEVEKRTGRLKDGLLARSWQDEIPRAFE